MGHKEGTATGDLERLQKALQDLRDVRAENASLHEELQTKEALLQGLIEHHPALFYVKDREGRYLHVNKEFERRAELTAEEMIGKTSADLFSEEVSSAGFDTDAELYATGQRVENEATFELPDGSRRTFWTVKFPLRGEGDEIVGLCGLSMDITDLRHSEQALRKSEKKYRRLVETAQEGIWVIDAEGITTFVNPRMAEMLGYEPEEMVGRHIFDFATDAAIEQARVNLKRRARGVRETHDYTLLHREGHRVHVTMATAPLTDEEGTYQGALAGVIDNTERKKTELALRQSEARLQSITEHAPDYIVQLDREGTILYMNRAPGSTTLADFIGGDIRSFMRKKEIPVFEEALQKVLDTGDVQSFETVGTVTDTWYACRMAPVAGVGTNPDSVIFAAHNVDNLKTTTHALLESETRLEKANRLFQLVLDTIPVRVFWKDTDSRYLGCNQLFAEDAGMEEPEDVIGLTDYDLAWRSEAERYRTDDQQVMESGEPLLDYEEPITNEAGERSWARTSKIPLRNSDGEIIGVLGTFEDITSRKEAEEAVRRSEERHRNLFDHAAEAIVVLDVDEGRFVDANPAALELFRLSRRELLDCGPVEVSPPMQPDGTPSAEGAGHFMEQALAGKSPVFEWMHLDALGSLIPCEVRLVRLPSTSENLLRGNITDLTEQKRAEEALRLSEERLRQSQKLDAIGQLAGGIAHDFNNQLTGIMGLAERLAERVDPELREDALAIFRSAEHAATLTEQLRAYARKGNLQTIPVDLHAILDEVASILERTIDKRITIERRYETAQAVVIGDPSQLQNVFMNLGLNARDAIPDGGRMTFQTSRVEEHLPDDPEEAPDPPFLLVEVRDTGVGMAPSVQKRIFEPFFTTKSEGRGTGMGLAAVYGTVTSHGGTVSVRSAPGEGSVFSIRLPAAPPADIPAPAEEEEREVTSPTPPGLHILLVDDEAVVRDVVRRSLEDAGYRVTTCSDGHEAIKWFDNAEGVPDLTLLDLMMPRLGGMDTLAAIRERHPDLPVVLVSGYGAEDLDIDLSEMAIQGLLQKPFRYETLLTTIQQALDT